MKPQSMRVVIFLLLVLAGGALPDPHSSNPVKSTSFTK
jgi:hypothetical protein